MTGDVDYNPPEPPTEPTIQMSLETLQSLVAQYGYYAVFFGTLLEGETILVLAGVAAHAGLLDFGLVFGLAAIGGTMGDQIYFFVGRRHGVRLLARFPALARKAARFQTLLQRYHAPVIVMVRFMYGLRIVGPIVIGTCRVPALRFVMFNATGALIWALVVAGAGYLFSDALQYVLENLHHFQVVALIALAAVALAIWAAVHLVSRRIR